MTPPVLLYTKTGCAFCDAKRAELTARGRDGARDRRRRAAAGGRRAAEAHGRAAHRAGRRRGRPDRRRAGRRVVILVPPPPGPALGQSWHAWAALAVGVAAVTAHSALSIGTSVLMKPILAEFGWDRTAWAASMTTRMLAMIAVVTWAGQLTDRLGARRVLAAGGLLMGVGRARHDGDHVVEPARRGERGPRGRAGVHRVGGGVGARVAAFPATARHRDRHPERRRQPVEQRRAAGGRRRARRVGLAADARRVRSRLRRCSPSPSRTSSATTTSGPRPCAGA